MSAKIDFVKTQYGATVCQVYGSVQDVIAGRCAEDLTWLDAGDYRYGFEVASPQGRESIGETVVVNGFCYSASTEADHLGQTLSGQRFVSNGIFLVPKDAQPSHRFSGDQSITMDDLVKKILEQAQAPCVYVAKVVFETLSATYVTKAPIHNENIFENKSTYYAKAPQQYHKVSAWIMGVVTDYNNPQLENANKPLEVVLYRNPFDSNGALSNHTHGVILSQDVCVTDIQPAFVDQVVHIFNQDTIIASIREGEIYTIADVRGIYSQTFRLALGERWL